MLASIECLIINPPDGRIDSDVRHILRNIFMLHPLVINEVILQPGIDGDGLDGVCQLHGRRINYIDEEGIALGGDDEALRLLLVRD